MLFWLEMGHRLISRRRAQRLGIVDSERLPTQIYRIHRTPKGHPNRRPTHFPFDVRVTSPVPLSPVPIVSCPRYLLSPPLLPHLPLPLSSSAYHLRYAPQGLNPTEGIAGEFIVVLVVGIVSRYTILVSGRHVRLFSAAVAALGKARVTGGLSDNVRWWQGRGKSAIAYLPR